jgi:hypothetical protein
VATELPQEVTDVVAHGRLGEAEPHRDLTGRDASCEELEYFSLASAQAVCGRGWSPAPRDAATSGLHLSL